MTSPIVTEPIRIDVAADAHPYPVVIGHGLAPQLTRLLDVEHLGARRFVVSSPPIWKLHGALLREAVPGAETILIPDGERFKHVQTVGRIYEALIRAGADRGVTLLAVGGGVVGDVAGFAAATFLRGVSLVQVPTTLLAQVDSAIGGKVGVNHALGKNLIGAFHPPRLVVTDPALLETLPRREFRSGLYEVVKYGMIASRALFDRVSANLTTIFAREPGVLVSIVSDSCRIKADVVSADEREKGPRRVLNFGHTIGHALEAATRYRRFRHGEAIAYGMLAAARIAATRGALDSSERDSLAALLGQLGPLPPVADLALAPILAAIGYDKKRLAGRLHFVLPTTIGATTIVNDVTQQEIRAALKAIGVRG